MRARHARMIRRGIYLAHDPLFSKYIELAPRLVQRAFYREQIAARYRVALAVAESARINRVFSDIIRNATNGADW